MSVVLAAVLVLPLSTASGQGTADGAGFMLQRSPGKPGETYYNDTLVEMSLDVREENSDTPNHLEVQMGGTQEIKIDSATADSTTLTTRLTRIVRLIEADGKVVEQFDTANPNQRAQMETVPALAQMLEGLKNKVRIVQGANGAVLRYETIGPDGAAKTLLDATYARTISNNVMMFPPTPVRAGSTWLSGQRFMDMPGIGKITRNQKVTFKFAGIGKGPGIGENEKVILLEISAAEPVFEPAPGRTGSLKRFEETGNALYSLDRNRIVYQELRSSILLEIADKSGRPNPIQAKSRIRTGAILSAPPGEITIRPLQ